MRWDDFRRSKNVEDRRGQSGGGFAGLPGGGRGGKLGIGTIVVLGIIGYALGIDPRILIGGAEMFAGGGGPGVTQQAPQRPTGQASAPPKDREGDFASAVLGSTEEIWTTLLPQQGGKPYAAPRLVLFRGATQSRCGVGQAAMGPFYCPVDQTVYLDLSFFEEMRSKFRVSGEFAYAYVIAHEVGHHVENVLGILPQVQQRQRQVSPAEANRLSVRVELMADCLAGVWANHADKKYSVLEPGDVENAMKAASAIGDDRLQKQSQGYVVPDSFTHGTSEQRVRWFMTGLKGGDMRQCDTFRAERL